MNILIAIGYAFTGYCLVTGLIKIVIAVENEIRELRQ